MPNSPLSPEQQLHPAPLPYHKRPMAPPAVSAWMWRMAHLYREQIETLINEREKKATA